MKKHYNLRHDIILPSDDKNRHAEKALG